MKFWEALAKQTKRGGHIKRKDHVFSLTNEQLYSFASSPIHVDDINADDWELYEEPEKTYTFMEAVQWLKQHKLCRPTWECGRYLFLDEYGQVRINMYGGEPWSLTMVDIQASDWVIVKDK